MKKILSVFLCLTIFLTYASVFAEVAATEELTATEQIVKTEENIINEPTNAEQNLLVKENTEAISDNEPDFKNELRAFFAGKMDEVKAAGSSGTELSMILFNRTLKWCLDEAYYIDTGSGAMNVYDPNLPNIPDSPLHNKKIVPFSQIIDGGYVATDSNIKFTGVVIRSL